MSRRRGCVPANLDRTADGRTVIDGALLAFEDLSLPSELLQAIAAPGGGRVTLVLGAGCSLEAPTAIPLSQTWSQESHDRLVANGVLAPGDCSMPSNLSALADAVFTRTGDQRLLVEQLRQNYHLETATPNEGHRLAAALLRERAVVSVLTLNFDLALSTAISVLGVGDTVAIINSAADLPNRKAINLYYLHGNAIAADPDTWILRTAALESEWAEHWESVVAHVVLASPVVVFVGLGSPADVLIESSRRIQRTIPEGTRFYQVDPAAFSETEFSRALALDPACQIRATWCAFMSTLSQRLLVEHASRLQSAAAAIVCREGFASEDLGVLMERVYELGLEKFGRLRASWLLHEKPYLPDDELTRELVADLLLALALVARQSGTSAVLCEDGIVEFRRGHQTVAALVLATGKGTRGRSALESQLSVQQRTYRARSTRPSGAVIAGTREGVGSPVSPPSDVVVGDTSSSIVFGSSSLPIFHVEALRRDASLCRRMAP